MSTRAEKPLNVEEFLAWAEGREGSWELYDGVPVAMAAEKVLHARVRAEAAFALTGAVRRAAVACEAFMSGLAVPIRGDLAFVPDALVFPLPSPPPEATTIPNPLIVVEVLSPSTAAIDHGLKLEGYFSLPSLAHYLILDPDRRVVIHHRRAGEGAIETRILHEGALTLDPPGLHLDVADLFGPPEA